MASYPKISAYCRTQPEAILAQAPIVAKRAPTTNDISYPIGILWIYPATNAAYVLTSVVANSATWNLLEASAGAGLFSSLVVTPGPITFTGTLTQTGTTNINTSGSGATNIGTGGTGAVNIGNTGGNVAVTGTLTASAGLTATTGGVTATAGNLVATNGNVILSTAGTFISMPGPVFIYSGAGAPAGGLALHIGDLYINTTAASATTRMYIATAAGTWTNFTCAG